MRYANAIEGIHTCRNPSHILDIPHSRPKQETRHDCFDDINRRCARFPWRVEIQPYWLHYPGIGRRSKLRYGITKLNHFNVIQFEASRLVMIQILLHNMKMDPLVSLHYYAPVCAGINLLFLPFTEGLAPFYELGRMGAGIMISNGSVAFLLNVAAVFLVGVGSGLVLTLAGVFKVRHMFQTLATCYLNAPRIFS